MEGGGGDHIYIYIFECFKLGWPGVEDSCFNVTKMA